MTADDRAAELLIGDCGRARFVVHAPNVIGGLLFDVEVSLWFATREEDGEGWYWARVGSVTVSGLAGTHVARLLVESAIINTLPVGRYELEGPHRPPSRRRRSRSEAADVAASVVLRLRESVRSD